MLLVTGITGHTGEYFLQEIANNKYEGSIRCVVRETSNTSLLDSSGLNVEKVIGDLEDPEFIDSVMQGVTTVMHIYNIYHSPRIVESAMMNKVKKIILVHTTGIYSEFKCASEEYKNIERKIHKIISNSKDLSTVIILRPSMIYGDLCDRNMSKFIKMVDKLRVMPVINGGNNFIQPVNARDLGKALYVVLMSRAESGKYAYDLSGEKPIKMIEAFKLISEELNKKTIFISVPLSLGVLIAKVIKSMTFRRVDYIERVQRMGEDRSYSHAKATRDFGYDPMSFEEGIKIEVGQYLENNKKV